MGNADLRSDQKWLTEDKPQREICVYVSDVGLVNIEIEG